MSKKRVHELAKELGMDNREVVLALQAAGISVKTHSSSVYEEEALAVLNKMKGPTPASTTPARRPGMVIVKKRHIDEGDADNVENASSGLTDSNETREDAVEASWSEPNEPAPEPQEENEQVEATPPSYRGRDEDSPAEIETVQAESSQQEPEALTVPVAEVAAPPAETVAKSEPATTPPAVEPKGRPEQKVNMETVVPQTKQSQPSQPTNRREGHEQSGRPPQRRVENSRPHQPRDGQSGQSHHQERGGQQPRNAGPNQQNPQGGQNQGQTAGGPGGSPNQTQQNRTPRPSTTPATVVRMIDRDKLLERVPGRRLGGGGPSGGRPGGSTGGRPAGAGTGTPGQRYGQVTELKVVTDPFGRGREMITVGRDKKKAGPAGQTPGANRNAPPGRGGKGRTPGKRDMNDMRERSMYPSRLKKKKANKRTPGKAVMTQPKASKRVIKMKETIVVADLAHQLGIKAVDVIRKLMGLGMMVTQNQSVDLDTAQLVATDHEYTVESVAFTEGAHIADPEKAEDEAKLVTRPPVVTVMGHVDHGKTSLLDAIRKERVAAGEHGGITQHIGAYSVPVPGKGSVTFLDTPGHAAFTSMRARGAQVTDIVVLVVAADDGVMPQTEEAIKHAQAAKVPIIVAVNKIDKPDANSERVMQELTKFELLPEAWGGQTLYVETSATKGTGIPELLESILLQAEVLELKANPQRSAVGVVVEAQLDRGRGPVATVLVQQGTLKRGDAIVVGSCSGRIRAMRDDQGRQLKEAGPSAAVEVTGLDAVPEAGDALNTVDTPEAARQVADHRMGIKRTAEQGSGAAMSLDDLMKRMEGASVLELKVVLKADVQGSAEAVKGALLKLSTDEVKVNVIYGGVGAISESDIMLAAASRGLVLGFGVRPDSGARLVAEREGVEIRTYTIIYEAVDDITKAMEGLLKPESREKIVGRAEVRELFRVSKVGVIGGCRVTEGKAMRAARVRVLRDSKQIYDGKVSSLRHFKNDAREVDSGLECGVGVEGFNDIKIGDAIEFYQVEEVARSLASLANKRPSGGGAEARP